jgi:hypothetical protein
MFALAIVRNNFIDGYGKYPMPWSTKKWIKRRSIALR